MFLFDEVPDSREFSLSPPSLSLTYRASGEFDHGVVTNYAIGLTAVAVNTQAGILLRGDIRVRESGHKQYLVTVPYAPPGQPGTTPQGSYHVDFDTSGTTIKMKAALEHIADYAADPDDIINHNGVIGVSDQEVEGADIVIPALRLNVRFKHPMGVMSLSQIKNLSRITGTVNSVPFLEFDAGELLYLGSSGSQGTDVETEVLYSFAASENATGLTWATITDIVKKGHHFAWVETIDVVQDGKPAKKVHNVHIERVYREVAWPLVFGWGG